MATVYYSSESSDSDSVRDKKSLDLSYLMLDSESLANYLKNSVREQYTDHVLPGWKNNTKVKSDGSLSTTNVERSIPEINLNNAERLLDNMEDLSIQLEKNKLEHKMESLSSEAVGNVLDSLVTTEEESGLTTSADFLQIRNKRRTINRSRTGSESSDGEGSITQDDVTEKLYLNHNLIIHIPFEIVLFHKLKVLDLSNNNLTHLNDFILQLPELQTLYVKNNQLDNNGIPKDLSGLSKIKEINLSGNLLTSVPSQIYTVASLRYLYLGGNNITDISPDIRALQNLQVLHLGGNQLSHVPESLGELSQLCALVLCNNRLRRLPRAISRLSRLRSLLLHRNNLCCLPVEIVKLRSLNELSLRDNPLVTRFVNSCAKELMFNPPSLKELAARTIRQHRVPYTAGDVPASLVRYLTSGHKCVNPKCKGVYFTSCVEHIKFVDFCGMYRLPLMHYLCSSRCTSQTPTAYYTSAAAANSDDSDGDDTMRRVLLG